jgi:hypothetical protein
MSPEGQKGRSDPALPLQWEAQAPTTLSVHPNPNPNPNRRAYAWTKWPSSVPTGKSDPTV